MKAVHVLLTVTLLALPGLPTASWAGALKCLTGTNPSVAGDLAQITAVRGSIDTNCPCAAFDGSTGKAHADYVSCVAGITTTASLRSQCQRTVLTYYKNSTCGRNPQVHSEPCIVTSLRSGKITCSIKPFTK